MRLPTTQQGCGHPLSRPSLRPPNTNRLPVWPFGARSRGIEIGHALTARRSASERLTGRIDRPESRSRGPGAIQERPAGRHRTAGLRGGPYGEHAEPGRRRLQLLPAWARRRTGTRASLRERSRCGTLSGKACGQQIGCHSGRPGPGPIERHAGGGKDFSHGSGPTGKEFSRVRQAGPDGWVQRPDPLSDPHPCSACSCGRSLLAWPCCSGRF